MLGVRYLSFFSVLFLFPLLSGKEAQAFVRTMSETGVPLFWASPLIQVRANPTNSSGLSESDVSTQLSQSFSAWSVPGTYAGSNYAQSTSYGASSNYDGVNAVYFASRASRRVDYGVVALTEVIYFVNSGQIAEADIVFNDNDFRFTANEGDTGKYIGGRMGIYLRDVATHEAGHAFGLDHSTVNLSSLIYTAFSGQFNLGEDDKTALRTIYPSVGGNGSLQGNVAGKNGGVFGAHVQAIHLATGRVQAGALADSNGNFRIGDLPPGQYAILMEPFGTSVSTVSAYYKNVNHRFCGGSRFRRRFYGPCGENVATVVEVYAGGATQLGALAPACNQMGNPAGAPTTLAAAKSLHPAGGAAYGTLRPGESHYYRVQGAAGLLEARALSYSLYSPIDVKVEILNANGSSLAGATSVDDVQSPMPGGQTNYDASAAANVPSGNYVVRVTAGAQRIGSGAYPAGFDLLDSEGHYLLSLGVDGRFGASTTSDMSACISVNNTAQSAYYRAPAQREESDRDGGGCGSLGASGSPWSGGTTQLLVAAALLHLALRMKRKAALVRKRR